MHCRKQLVYGLPHGPRHTPEMQAVAGVLRCISQVLTNLHGMSLYPLECGAAFERSSHPVQHFPSSRLGPVKPLLWLASFASFYHVDPASLSEFKFLCLLACSWLLWR